MPRGVVSVICWPASVKGTVDAIGSGRPMPSLGSMGNWTIITDEMFDGDKPSGPHAGVHGA